MRFLLLLVGLVDSVAALHRGLFFGRSKESFGRDKITQPTLDQFARHHSLPAFHPSNPLGQSQPFLHPYHIVDHSVPDPPLIIYIPLHPDSLGQYIMQNYGNEQKFFNRFFIENAQGLFVPNFFCDKEGLKCYNVFYDKTDRFGNIIEPFLYEPVEPSSTSSHDSYRIPEPRRNPEDINFPDLDNPAGITAEGTLQESEYNGHPTPKRHQNSRVDEFLEIQKNSGGSSPADTY